MFDQRERKHRPGFAAVVSADPEGLFLLWQRMLAAPDQISMLAPSSPYVGRAMAGAIGDRPTGPVVELGAGTGAISRQLLARCAAAPPLTALEVDPKLCAHLRRTQAGVDVVCAPAQELSRVWRERDGQPVGAVVSTLPVRLFSIAEQQRVLDAVAAVLAPGGILVQLTYRLTSPIRKSLLAPRFRVERRIVVLRNLPPAFIWLYRRTADGQYFRGSVISSCGTAS